MGELTLRVQQFREAQVLFCQVKCILQIVVRIGFLQLVEINQVRPVGNRHNQNYGSRKKKDSDPGGGAPGTMRCWGLNPGHLVEGKSPSHCHYLGPKFKVY